LIIRNLDFYCERLDPSFWAEPVNALTNLGFVIVGLWALVQFYRLERPSADSRISRLRIHVLCWFLILIGLGSFLFHTTANNLTIFADLIPIFIFTSVYLYHSTRRLLNMSAFLSGLLLIFCIVSMVILELMVPRSILNGSALYFPPLIFLFSIGYLLFRQNKFFGKYYLLGAFTFLGAIVFRTLDLIVCPDFPLGTHFLWHLLNSLCLGFLIFIALRFEKMESGN
jgi:hypothetical protein